MSITATVLSAIVFIAGALAVVAGVVRINHLHFRLGGILLILGLVLAIGAGQDLRQRFFLSDTHRKIRDTEQSLARAREQRALVERQRERLKKDLDLIVRNLRDKVNPEEDLQSRMSADTEVRSLVEKAAQVRRWLAKCDTALGDLAAAEKSLENTLFYLRYLVTMERIGDESLSGAAASALEKEIKDYSQTPPGGSVALPPGDEEVAAIRALIAQ